MSLTALAKSLERQSQNLRNFLIVVKSKQEALISRDRQQLELSLEGEERFILLIEKEENNRMRILKQLVKEFSLDDADEELMKLPVFLGAINEEIEDDILHDILDKQSKVKELTSEVAGVNKQNQFLIQNAKNLIKEIISAVAGDKKQSLIDRKI